MTLTDVIASTPFFAIAVFFGYEGFAVATKLVPTISRIMAYDIDTHPPVEAVPAAFALGMITYIIIEHVAGMLRWWKP